MAKQNAYRNKKLQRRIILAEILLDRTEILQLPSMVQKEILYDLVNEVFRLIMSPTTCSSETDSNLKIQNHFEKLNKNTFVEHSAETDMDDGNIDSTPVGSRPHCQLSYKLISKLYRFANEPNILSISNNQTKSSLATVINKSKIMYLEKNILAVRVGQMLRLEAIAYRFETILYDATKNLL